MEGGCCCFAAAALFSPPRRLTRGGPGPLSQDPFGVSHSRRHCLPGRGQGQKGRAGKERLPRRSGWELVCACLGSADYQLVGQGGRTLCREQACRPRRPHRSNRIVSHRIGFAHEPGTHPPEDGRTRDTRMQTHVPGAVPCTMVGGHGSTPFRGSGAAVCGRAGEAPDGDGKRSRQQRHACLPACLPACLSL